MTNRDNAPPHSIHDAFNGPPPYDGFSRDEWLRMLYDRYTDRFLADNGRIWETGAIMIPVSLAGFAVLAGVSEPTRHHVVLLAIFSIATAFIWLVIAENHRSFQQKSMAVVRDIEGILRLPRMPDKKKEKGLNGWITFPGAIQKMRWTLVALVILTWLGLFAWWPVKG